MFLPAYVRPRVPSWALFGQHQSLCMCTESKAESAVKGRVLASPCFWTYAGKVRPVQGVGEEGGRAEGRQGRADPWTTQPGKGGGTQPANTGWIQTPISISLLWAPSDLPLQFCWHTSKMAYWAVAQQGARAINSLCAGLCCSEPCPRTGYGSGCLASLFQSRSGLGCDTTFSPHDEKNLTINCNNPMYPVYHTTCYVVPRKSKMSALMFPSLFQNRYNFLSLLFQEVFNGMKKLLWWHCLCLSLQDFQLRLPPNGFPPQMRTKRSQIYK